jgi:hypothetical protein
MNPTIVVAGYDRPDSLKRLLKSLIDCRYPDSGVRLIISIDGGGASEVGRVAEAYAWPYGEKRVLQQEANLGLREHILRCGDLTEQYGSIIMLEDDIGVSQWFYQYAVDALSSFGADERIAGISLYRYSTNVNCGYRFDPIDFGLGCFLMQVPQSWGQVWSLNQWRRFRDWYNEDTNRSKPLDVPANVAGWPESSWLKYFTRYVVDTGRYFVYPAISHSTNYSDPGTHMLRGSNSYQVPLATGPLKLGAEVRFEDCAKYDVYFELKSESLCRLAPNLDACIEVDLYGCRDLSALSDDALVLTVRRHRNAMKQYGMQLRPRELNVSMEVPGDVIGLVLKKDLDLKDSRGLYREFGYEMRWFGKRLMLKLFKETLCERLAR